MHEPAATMAMASLRLQSPADELERDCTKADRNDDSGDLLPSLYAQP